jgi:acyl-CoA synthetase (NDP forming)
MKHELDPLLRPRSVAVVGASAREDSMGEWSLTNLIRGGFSGNIYPVNPGYDALQSLRCYKSLIDLPEVPDLVLFAVSDQRIEEVFDEAIELAVPAAVLMSSMYVDDDKEPFLKDRIREKIHAAGMLVCGANGMGFYNIRDSVWACGFDSRMHLAPGNASLISHSGSGMCGIIDCEERLRVNFAVSTGNELSVSMDQYLDFVLDLPETRVVGLFIETARNPDGFRAALEKAVQKRIPIVALKVGRTRKSVELTISHSGALAGDDATYDALFERYGVHRVHDMDELATALILFAELNPLGPGGLVTLHDSGGERQLIVDLADAAGVPMTDLGADTVAAIKMVLDPELPAVNPLDAWSRGGETAASRMTDCLALMMQDDDAALGAIVHDRGPDGLSIQLLLTACNMPENGPVNRSHWSRRVRGRVVIR